MRIGIIGLPQCGKTAVFSAVTGVAVRSHAREAHLGVVHVPDERLDHLVAIESSVKRTPPEVAFVDMPSLETDGHGQGEEFGKWIRDADALLTVVGGALVEEGGQALGELDRVLQELVLTDLVTVESRIERIDKDIARGRREGERERGRLLELRAVLEAGGPLREASHVAEILPEFVGFAFLTARPLVAILNRPNARASACDAPFGAGLAERGLTGLAFDAAFEWEVLELDDEMRTEMMASEGLESLAADRVVRACYEALDVVTFYTAGPKESRAIAIRRGTSAWEAAGKIHSDIQKGFVRAEVVGYEALAEAGSWNGAKSAGKFRLEGRDYVMRDGDVVYFRFTS